VAERDLPKALRELCDSEHVAEAVVLSTCLRTEVYAVVERFHDGVADIETFFRSRSSAMGPDSALLSDHLFCWIDDAAISHLFDVAAGIDSPVLGEGEILRQVRSAAELAHREHAAGPVLGTLFRHAVEAGKRVRSETGIAQGTTSLAHAAVALAADQLEGGFEGRSVLVIGAGEMGAGFSKALAQPAVPSPARVVVANRSAKRAAAIAEEAGAEAVSLAHLDEELGRADVVLTSTAADEMVLDAVRIDRTMRSRPDRPLLVVDVAVPRDVDPAVARLEGVRLLDVEDVRRFAEAQMATRRREIPAVRAMLAEELERYRVSSAARSAAPVVAALRARADSIRRAELERHQARLDALGPGAREIVEEVTQRTVAKLLHEPTVRVKDAAGSPRGERLAEALRSLFDL
ncbi:MAG TPA: glutamyl-tRNA reductase, partial [Acidimicrobiales bacterium]|nr:glutamyl-tRNA reductase [Acidimicrobiales bacterium]